MTQFFAAHDVLVLASVLREMFHGHSWVAEMVSSYGYLFLFVGTFLEGESVVLAGGFAAYHKLLSLPVVYLVCFIGSFLGDQFWFYIGRWKGGRVLDRFPKFKGNFAKVRRWMGRGEDLAVVASRFIPGTRMATPLLLASGGYSAWRFAMFNAIGAAVWSLSLASLGWYIAKAAGSVGIQRKFQLYILAGLGLFGLTWWLVSSIARRTAAAAKAKMAHRHERQAMSEGGDEAGNPTSDPTGGEPASPAASGGGCGPSGSQDSPGVSIPSNAVHSIHAGGDHGSRASER